MLGYGTHLGCGILGGDGVDDACGDGVDDAGTDNAGVYVG